jgi:imidazolonepropionase-like amidohydrolase
MNHVSAKTIYTGKRVVSDAHLLFKDNKIIAVSKIKEGRKLGEFEVLTPAFIDPHSHIGLERAGEPSAEGEANEHQDSIIALTDAMEMGVLYSCVMPGSGNIIGGHSAVIRHYARSSSNALITRAGLKGAFGFNPMKTYAWKGKRPTTRMGAVAMLRSRLDEVRQKMQKLRKARGSKRADIHFSAEDKVLRDLLNRKMRLRAHVHKIDDIAALLRVVDEFKIQITVDHACDVHRPEIFRELKNRGIAVVYGPIDSFAYKVELKHEDWRNVRHLLESGVDFGLMTDHPVTLSRQLLLQTRWFMRAGLSKQQAIELISHRNAKILGIDDRLGALDRGKWASFVCWNGDPFDLASYPVAVFGEGELLYSE